MIVESYIEVTEPFEVLFKRIATKINITPEQILGYTILRRSIDARKKNKIKIFYRLDIAVDNKNIGSLKSKLQAVPEQFFNKPISPEKLLVSSELKKQTQSARKIKPIIIGSGPAGIFAALTFVANGIKPIIIEQGARVEQRLKHIKELRYNAKLKEDSNIAFGEGGAGMFSDGKLFTRKNHILKQIVLKIFHYFGASHSVLYDVHPHIGSNKLVKIQKQVRAYLIERGAQFLWNTKAVDINEKNKKVIGIITQNNDFLYATHVLSAHGNSAETWVRALESSGAKTVFKPFAVGFRIEHPRELINSIQFRAFANNKRLGPAEYALRYNKEGRGGYTFCMCPGGYVVPSHCNKNTVRINGMSNSARNSYFSNSAVVLTVSIKDVAQTLGKTADEINALDGFLFQKRFEKAAFELGGSNYFVPAQRLIDFLQKKQTNVVPATSFRPGIRASSLHTLFPDYMTQFFSDMFRSFNNKMSGFISKEALLLAPETATSSPVRIVRDDRGESISLKGLYPIGEGSGYSGGIVSSAIDGIKISLNIIGE